MPPCEQPQQYNWRAESRGSRLGHPSVPLGRGVATDSSTRVLAGVSYRSSRGRRDVDVAAPHKGSRRTHVFFDKLRVRYLELVCIVVVPKDGRQEET